jgi:hypothetical protein
MVPIVVDLATPKAAAKLEFLFNKLTYGGSQGEVILNILM